MEKLFKNSYEYEPSKLVTNLKKKIWNIFCISSIYFIFKKQSVILRF